MADYVAERMASWEAKRAQMRADFLAMSTEGRAASTLKFLADNPSVGSRADGDEMRDAFHATCEDLGRRGLLERIGEIPGGWTLWSLPDNSWRDRPPLL